MDQLKILSRARKRVFDDVPKLNTTGRKALMVPDRQTKLALKNMKPANKVGFLVQRAYFLQKARFFPPSKYRKIDVREAERSLGLKATFRAEDYHEQTMYKHRDKLRTIYGWRRFNARIQANLTTLCQAQSKEHISYEDQLFALLEYCWYNRHEIPSYATLEGIVSQANKTYWENITHRLSGLVTEEQDATLFSFISPESFGSNFANYRKIRLELDRKTLSENADLLTDFRQGFAPVEPLFDELGLSNFAVREIADWIYKSDVTQVRRLKDKALLRLRLLAYVKDQFYRRQDASALAFIKVMRGALNKARGVERKKRLEVESEALESNRLVASTSKNAHALIKMIGDVSKSSAYSLSEKNIKVTHLVDSYLEATDPDIEQHTQRVENNLNRIFYHSNYYDHLFDAARSIEKTLSPIIRALVFNPNSKNTQLLKAIQQYQMEGAFGEHVPVSFLKKKDLVAIEKPSDLPETLKHTVLLFSHIHEALKDRTLTLNHSYLFVDENALSISETEWQKNRNDLLISNMLERFVDGPRILKQIGEKTKSAFTTLNSTLEQNSFVKPIGYGKWRTSPDEPDFSAEKFISQLLQRDKAVTLYEVMSEIDGYCQFSSNFTHFQSQHTKRHIDPKRLYATLMSLGTNIGHTEMEKACRKYSYKQLRDTETSRFSIKNLEQANSTIVQFIQSLPLPTIFNDHNDQLHTSSDGKKFVVAVDSLLANYSYKYYGKEQGVSVNSFVDTSQSFFHVNVLASSDREAAFMMDGIARSRKNFESSKLDWYAKELHDDLIDGPKHSTDTHGYTDAIFAGLYFLDVSFAPRLSRLKHKRLFGYDSQSLLKNNPQWRIGPTQQVNRKEILEHWDDILRLMATIKSGRQSASLIFRHLSSSKKASGLYKALVGLGRLLKSNFIATYMMNEDLRRSIQKQLNRAELGQKFSSAVFYGRKGNLVVGDEESILRAMLCKTILKNIVILWNYLYLSDYILEMKNHHETTQVLESISEGSVISWRHINPLGIIDFDHKPLNSFKSSIQQMKSLVLS